MKPSLARIGSLFVVGVALLGVACSKKPVEGDLCRDLGHGTCVDATRAFSCRSYTWRTDRCRGPHGCQEKGDMVTCDQSIAENDDPCGEPKKSVCSADKKRVEQCDGATFHTMSTCLGPNGCSLESDGAHCDASVANEGDPCLNVHNASGGTFACNSAGDTELSCIDGVFVRKNRCLGPHGCGSLDGMISCDQTIGEEGGACSGVQESCAADGRTALRCTDYVNGHWMVAAHCGGPEGCSAGYRTWCDQSIAEVGERCTDRSSQVACSKDRKELLHCDRTSGVMREGLPENSCAVRDGAMSTLRRCPHHCTVTGSSFSCG